jgi:hypothetical protein
MILIWASLISPYIQYGDNWAIYLILAVAFLILGWPTFLNLIAKRSVEANAHSMLALFASESLHIFFISIMMISKNSLWEAISLPSDIAQFNRESTLVAFSQF